MSNFTSTGGESTHRFDAGASVAWVGKNTRLLTATGHSEGTRSRGIHFRSGNSKFPACSATWSGY